MEKVQQRGVQRRGIWNIVLMGLRLQERSVFRDGTVGTSLLNKDLEEMGWEDEPIPREEFQRRAKGVLRWRAVCILACKSASRRDR